VYTKQQKTYKLEFVYVLQEIKSEDFKRCVEKEWRVGGADEEECKQVVKVNCVL